jgi:hypothetical protein
MPETCANCGSTIGNLEPAMVWKNHVVCADCRRKLKAADDAISPVIPYATPRPRRRPLLAAAIGFACIIALGAVAGGLFLGRTSLPAPVLTTAPPPPVVSSPTPQPPVKRAVDVVTAADVLAYYDENEIEADGVMKGNVIQIRGVIDSIGRDALSTPYVTLRGGSRSHLGHVQFLFEDADEPRLSTLKPGVEITLQGRGRGKAMLNVVLDESRFVE